MIEDVVPVKKSRPVDNFGDQGKELVAPSLHSNNQPEETIVNPDNQNQQLQSHSEPTPDVVIDETQPEVANPSSNSGEQKPQKPFWKRKKFIIIGAVSVLLFGSGGALFALNRSETPPQPVAVQKKQKPAPKPIIYTSPLSGAVVAAGLEKRPVTAIMIENSLDARPQSGLRDASIVFEAIAEGGITRFLTLYQEGEPGYIGPVRSLRPYYLDWAAPFNASIVHVGGSLDSLQQIRDPNQGLRDIDQFFNPGTFSRIPERYAPHNVYTSSARLDELIGKKGFSTSTFTPWTRKVEAPSKAPNANKIDLVVSGPAFNVHYDYQPETNSYVRNQGGALHTDITSAQDPSPQPLRPKVVVALVMPYSYGAGSDGNRSTYNTYGTGKMYLFQDGIVTEGTWSKPDRKTPFSFVDAAGKALPMNPGQTWLTVVSTPTAVRFVP